jgi:hypothetical protein
VTTFAPGTRVVVRGAGHLTGQTGVVVESPDADVMVPWTKGAIGGYDVAVLLDEDHGRPCCELGFYAHELTVAK